MRSVLVSRHQTATIPTPLGGEHAPRALALETRAIFEALLGLRVLWIVEGASHHNFQRYAPEQWAQRVDRFLGRAKFTTLP